MKKENRIAAIYARFIFDLILLIAAIIFFIGSLSFDFKPWLFPGVFSLLLLIMVVIQIFIDLRELRERRKLPYTKSKEPTSLKILIKDNEYVRMGLTVLGVVLFYLLFLYVTIYLAVVGLCFLLLYVMGGRSWKITLIVAAGLDAFIYVFFQLFLGASL